jgi:DNA-binding MarR family transcriptional regulator
MTSEQKRRALLVREVQDGLRDLIVRLQGVNNAVASHVELRPGDIELLDLVARHGPMSPSEVTAGTGIHPATLTGVIDRLESGGWMTRVPDPDDRRRIRLQALRDRGPELVKLYGPMNRSMAEICADLTPSELEVVRDFLRAAATAGNVAAAELRADL